MQSSVIDTFSIDLPLPHKNLNANSGLAARFKSQNRAKARNDAKRVAEDIMFKAKIKPPKWKEIAVHYHFRWQDGNHRLDTDNSVMSAKFYLDGLKEFIVPARRIPNTQIVEPAQLGAGVIKNDDNIMDLRVTWSYDKTNPGITITITPWVEEKAA